MRVCLTAFAAAVIGLLPSAAHAQNVTPTFRKTVLDSRFRSEGVAVADFNRDSFLDIAAGSVWYQGPNWTMRTFQGVARQFDPVNFSDSFHNFADDFNGDGWSDLLIVDFPGGSGRWLRNPGAAGGLWPQFSALSVVNNEQPLWIDVTGDGRKELLAAFVNGTNPDSSTRRVGYARPGTTPTAPWIVTTLSDQQAPGSHRFDHGMGLGDVNRDGRLDVITSSGWYERPLDPNAAVWPFRSTGFFPPSSHVHVLDADGDGDHDLISSSAHDYGVWWSERTPTGYTRRTIDAGTSQTHGSILADIDGNGLPDLITGKRKWAHGPGGDPGSEEPSELLWFELEHVAGRPVWTRHVIDSLSGIGNQFEVLDVNGDSRLDIVVANKNGVFYFEQVPEPRTAPLLLCFAAAIALLFRRAA